MKQPRPLELLVFTIEDDKISHKNQKQNWSYVGMLFYLVKHLHPGIANLEAYKEMHQLSSLFWKKEVLDCGLNPIKESNNHKSWSVLVIVILLEILTVEEA